MTISFDVNPERRKHESAFQVNHWLKASNVHCSSVMRAMSTFRHEADFKDLSLQAAQINNSIFKNTYHK